ncbi:hypothetical protein [Pseudomonas cavernae]|uniref:hypothetical protein n=1 Tax=Pseudomonas cavernae TaxID=2320867 RepID=UPI0015A78DE5|nr:hypothetical protein [Pseudomonas cavernae]
MAKLHKIVSAGLAALILLSPLAQAWHLRGGARTQVFQHPNFALHTGQRPMPGSMGGGI